MSDSTIVLNGSRGVFRLADIRIAETGNGVIGCFPVELPAYDRACHYAPFQKYAINPGQELWPEGYNQCQPLAVDDLSGAKCGGMFALLRLIDGGYLALLPLATSEYMAYFTSCGGRFCVEVAHWGIGGYAGSPAVLAWAQDDNPYVACERVWREALRLSEIRQGVALRTDKAYPEPFEYLGWCSWEQYKEGINDRLMVETLLELDSSTVPVRWLMVDDGHQNFTPPTAADLELPEIPGEISPVQMKKRLTGFGVDPSKFSNGWKRLKEAQAGTEITWLGVWLNFNGYWGGIDVGSDFGDLEDTLLDLGDGVRQPSGEEGADRFYDAYVAAQQQAGFDFIKVDNQASNIVFYQGKVESAVPYAVANHRALEKACAKRLNGLINCMAHNTLGLFNTRESAVTRCSEDYLFEDEWRGKMHLFNSFGNMMLFGPTVWGDHDMFHSTDAFAGAVMARSKALSGGPVYLSDDAAQIDAEAVQPLSLSDGRILRPAAPAVPLPDSLFMDPYKDNAAFRVVAPLRHGTAVVALYNLTHPEKPVSGTVSADDYRWAGGMLQNGAPEWDAPEGIVIYDVLNCMVVADHETVSLPGFGDGLYLLCPIRKGWAVIGNPEKYLCSEAVETVDAEGGTLALELYEPCDVLVWSQGDEAPVADGPVERVGSNLWKIGATETKVAVKRAEEWVCS